MKFLGDMGISQTTINWLKEKRYDALHLREEGLSRISDEERREEKKGSC